MQGEIKCYAISMDMLESIGKAEAFGNMQNMFEGFLGIHPDYPLAYLLFDTKEHRQKAYIHLKNKLRWKVKLMQMPAYVDEKHYDKMVESFEKSKEIQNNKQKDVESIEKSVWEQADKKYFRIIQKYEDDIARCQKDIEYYKGLTTKVKNEKQALEDKFSAERKQYTKEILNLEHRLKEMEEGRLKEMTE